MSVFEYIALDEKGRQLKGFIDASGISAARQKLREENIFPVEINQAEQKLMSVFEYIALEDRKSVV